MWYSSHHVNPNLRGIFTPGSQRVRRRDQCPSTNATPARVLTRPQQPQSRFSASCISQRHRKVGGGVVRIQTMRSQSEVVALTVRVKKGLLKGLLTVYE